MAIILKCSKCREHLEVDDGFAGGICRCAHCGALSHVPLQPTQMDRKGRPAAPPEMARPVVAMPGNHDNLAIAPTRRYIMVRKRRGLLAIVMMVMALAMLVAVVWMAIRLFKDEGPDDRGPGLAGTRESPNPYVQKKGPHFVGLELVGEPVAYLLNTGSSMRQVFDGAGLAIELSVRTLGKGRFTALTWSKPASTFMGEAVPAEAPVSFPADGLADNDQADRDKLREWLRGLSAGGVRDPAPAVEAALERRAVTVVLVTAGDMEPEQVQAIRQKLAGRKANLLAAALGATVETCPNLVALVGQKAFKAVSEEELQGWLQEVVEPAAPAPGQ